MDKNRNHFEEYKYPSFLSFPAKWGGEERKILIFSWSIKKNWRESEITGYQNIQTSKTQGFLALLEEERGRKGVSGLAAIGREIGEEDIMISQVIRILNIS